MTDLLLPTSLVGSYPQPDWLIDRAKLAGRFPPRVRAKELWRVAPEFLEEAQDDATLLAIRAQEKAGLDIITDGEMRRESYSNRFATALEGVDIDNPGTALDRSGHVPGPPPLEARAGHHAVLHREHGEQADIDDDRLHQGRFDGAVDGSGHRDAGDETGQVDEDREEHKVANEAVQQRSHARHTARRLLGTRLAAVHRASGIAHDRHSFSRRGYRAGSMFWLMRNTLWGSYSALTAVSRW